MLNLEVVRVAGDDKRVHCLPLADIVDINMSDRIGKTPLIVAAWKGRQDVFGFLVGRGADESVTDAYSNNILHWACHGDIVDINSRGKYDRTPVMVAAEFGHIDVLELLVREGGDVNLRSDAGNTILHAACLGGYVKVVSHVLTTTHVDINAQGIRGGPFDVSGMEGAPRCV
ncbi:serine/threonine-protein phosphatase 6 regulatory ankyrin repeat subunit C-like [Haliotis rubra]|uniref:serine/threonine-protein phosphatase 6 regulatory ankyrin repeat subunit C-like n=1 Tax=Haliotis rubra TaxID=36100 RepID=UPI001EE565DF|nr:serine/threonine-protein phosphatase 6 regulatory ankyrin repeat subunit C-like [Haliotis rubra]